MDKPNILYTFNGQASECHFFSMFADICSYLYDEDYNVFLSWKGTKYCNSDNNILDYVFIQEKPKKFDLIEYGPNVKKFKTEVKKFFDSNPSRRLNEMEKFNLKFWKTFKLNDKLNLLINKTLEKIKDKKTLSVHIRRSDILKLNYFSPFINFDPNNMETYYEIIDNMFISGGYEKIFLCTEDKNIFDFIVSKFDKDVVIYNDNYRGIYDKIDNSVSQEHIYNLNRENNGQTLLLEIMSDVLVSSKCDAFLGTKFSGVSIFIELFNNNKFKQINYF